jgi:hypothetical protein
MGVLLSTQYAGASGLGWVMYGKILSASTCAPISSAIISSPYNNNAYNISKANGNYTLVLGTGKWSVSLKANGYYSGSYPTLYEKNGAVNINLALVPIGGFVEACPGAITVNTLIMTASQNSGVNATQRNSTGTSAASAPVNTSSGSNGNIIETQPIEAAVLAVILIIAAVALIVAALMHFTRLSKKEGA